MRVRVKAQHGQFYACVYGRDVSRMTGSQRRWRRFWVPSVVGLGQTPGAAITQAGELIETLEQYDERTER